MGLLVNGQWQEQALNLPSGEFIRADSQFRHTIGGANNPFQAESGRYHLFVAMACPWAHRCLIFRQLKQLETHIGITTVDPKMLAQGWEFSQLSTNSPLPSLDYLYQVYQTADSNYSGRVTVPLLWDTQLKCIVNNESADIIRIFNKAFNSITDDDKDFYPEDLQIDIDAMNARIYSAINNGVYKAGFATNQAAYESAYSALFAELDALDNLLGRQRFLLGNKLTEADWRLFTTLIRFDSVYYSHFKCNRQRIEDYPFLSGYLRELYQVPGIGETCDMQQIKTHYYFSHRQLNPSQIIPLGPDIDYDSSYYRGL